MISFNNKTSSSFITGFKSTFGALPFMLKNKMGKFMALPFVINIIVLCVAAWYAFSRISQLLEKSMPDTGWYLHIMHYLVLPLLVILIIVVTFLLYSITGTLLASPFLDIISFKTETAMSGSAPDAAFSIGDIFRMLKSFILMILFTFMAYIIFLPLYLFPFGGIIYGAVSFTLTAFFCGFQFYEMPFDRRGFSFFEKLRISSRYATTICGTGMSFMLISFIPVAGFLGIVVATSGATIAFKKVIEPSIARID